MRSYKKDMRKGLSMSESCQNIVRLLTNQGIEFLVGGYYALRHHTGIDRETKDFDLMVRPSDVDTVLQLCRSAGYSAERAYSHWLAKIHHQECFVDLIFNSSNGLCPVDEEWFSRSVSCNILDMPVKIIPLEELIWQKATSWNGRGSTGLTSRIFF
jgi:predicted nucleotidyltransferase